MSGLYSDIEVKLGEILSKHPEMKNDSAALFEKASGIKVGDDIKVCLHDLGDADFAIVIPPSPEEIKKTMETNEALGKYFTSLFIEPGETDLSDSKPQQIIANLAWSDSGYLNKLKTSPRETLNSLLNEKFPQEINVSVCVDSVDTVHLNVPPDLSKLEKGTLDESQLEQVTGGIAPVVAAAAIGGGLALTAAIVENKDITEAVEDGAKKVFKAIF